MVSIDRLFHSVLALETLFHIKGTSRRYLQKKDVPLYWPSLLVKLWFIGEALREASSSSCPTS